MVNACWAPNSRAIITESDFGIQLAIWSLTESSTIVISSPKQSAIAPTSSSSSAGAVSSAAAYAAAAYRSHDSFNRVHATVLGSPLANFSDCRALLAVVHRIESHDHVSASATHRPFVLSALFFCLLALL